MPFQNFVALVPGFWILSASLLSAQGNGPPRVPILRVETQGPTATITCMAFSSDGKTLFAAGFDKVVHSWNLQNGLFVAGQTYRVPIGPGISGAINALAVSPDGKWIAVGGEGLMAESSGFDRPGIMLSKKALTEESLLDEGQITLLPIDGGKTRALRGHKGTIYALQFLPEKHEGNWQLVSLGSEGDSQSREAVARLWDVATEKELVKPLRSERFDNPNTGAIYRPVLTVWRSGKNVADVKAAWAVNGQPFRIWDVAAGELIAGKTKFLNAKSLTRLGKDQLVTGAVTLEGQGVLNVRSDAALIDAAASFTLQGTGTVVPEALQAIPGHDTAQLAGLLWHVDGKNRPSTFQLQLFQFQEKLRPVSSAIPIWDDGPELRPLLAASQSHIALAGHPSHKIQIYSIKNLLAGRVEPELLHHNGTKFNKVQFVCKQKGKEKRLGLRLEESSDVPRKWIFDFQDRTMSFEDPKENWVVDEPDLTGIELPDLVKGKRKPENPDAVLPALAPLNIPLLAVAEDKGEPKLLICHGRTGETLRWCVGHQDQIRSIAFSKDGTRLAATSNDCTVCVWNLADLPDVVDKLALLDGVAVRRVDGKLKVKTVDPALLLPKNRGKLREGDSILGIVQNNKFRELNEPIDFYHAIANTPAGSRDMRNSITLRVQQGDAQPKQVELQLSQGIDDRKPLFSLYVKHTDDAKTQPWIGWTPLGKYDASDLTIEQSLGWHFNTGDRTQPTEYSKIIADRKTRKLHGLLQALMATGKEPEEVAPRKHKPSIQMKLFESDQTKFADELALNQKRDRLNRLAVPHGKATLWVGVDGIPNNEIDQLTWQVGDESGTLDLDEAKWLADLSKIRWQKGTNLLRVFLRSQTCERREYEFTLPLYYEPAPPTITVKNAPRGVVMAQDYELELEVEPALGEEAEIVVNHQANQVERTLPAKKVAGGKKTLKWNVKLKEGMNRLQIVGKNTGLPESEKPAETAQSLEVNYMSAAPSIVLQRLTTVIDEPGTSESFEIRLGQTIRVVEDKIRILGEISSVEALDSATWAVVKEKENPAELEGFISKKSGKYKIDKTVSLMPGIQKFRFVARNESGKTTEAVLAIDYQFRPGLPLAEIKGVPRETDWNGTDSPGEKLLKFKISLDWPKKPHACEAHIILNEKKLPNPIALAPGQQTFDYEVRLRPGANRLMVQLSHPDAPEVVRGSDLVETTYRRLPVVVDLQSERDPTLAVATLTAQVKTPKALPITAKDVFVNGQSEAETELVAVEGKGDVAIYKVAVKSVSLQAGDNHFAVQVTNAEGSWFGKAPSIAGVIVDPPSVEVLSPGASFVTVEDEVAIQFLVRSKSPLRQIRLIHDGKNLPISFDNKERFELRKTFSLKLNPGPNHIRISASNQKGEQVSPSEPLEIVSLSRPVQFGITAVSLQSDKTRRIANSRMTDNVLHFPEVSDGKIVVHGKLEYHPENQAQIAKIEAVHVYQNGARLRDVQLKRTADKDRSFVFEIPVTLRQHRNNAIQVRLPDLTQAAANHRLPNFRLNTDIPSECVIDVCTQPAPPARRRLWVLIVSNRKPDRKTEYKALAKKVIESVGGKIIPSSDSEQTRFEFEKPGFEDGGVCYYLDSQIDWIKKFRGSLVDINGRIKSLIGQTQHVTMLYYCGDAEITDHDTLLGEPDSEGQNRLSSEDLRGDLARSYGSQILLMDVVHRSSKSSKIPRDFMEVWPEYPNLAVVRYGFREMPQVQPVPLELLMQLRTAMSKNKLKEVTLELSRTFEPMQRNSLWRKKTDFGADLIYTLRQPRSLEELTLSR